MMNRITNDINVLKKIKSMDEETISLVYPPLKRLITKSFYNFLNFGLEADDVAQEVIICIIKNKKTPDQLEYTVVSYLLKIAERIIIAEYNKRKILVPVGLSINNQSNTELPNDPDFTLYSKLLKHIKNQSGICQKLFYEFSQTMNMDQLAQAMNYNSPQGASQQKKRCIDKLYESIEEEDPELAKLLKKRKQKSDGKEFNKAI